MRVWGVVAVLSCQALTWVCVLSRSARHPKLQKLVELLSDHFQRAKTAGRSTRAIVFTQYRDSVGEIVELLRELQPLVMATSFVGQATSKTVGALKGQTQKEQQAVVKDFRAGLLNTLVATCIGEEGLDVGDVDLIVSFDAVGSPTRMVQRMGRTGRKRAGRIVVLVTEGDEHRKLKNAQRKSAKVTRLLQPQNNSVFTLYVGGVLGVVCGHRCLLRARESRFMPCCPTACRRWFRCCPRTPNP